MSVCLTKSPSIPAALSAGLYVLLPDPLTPDPFLVFDATPHPQVPGYVTLTGGFDTGRDLAPWFATVPERRRLPVLPG